MLVSGNDYPGAAMIIEADARQLVTVETIASLRPILDADAIEAATVRGWTVVVKNGQFTVGDPVVYIEVDVALPIDDERFAFLAARGTKDFGGRPCMC